MVRIALIGYGRMGRIIGGMAQEKGHEIAAIVDPYCEGCLPEITEETLGDAEVCVDFTQPNVAVENIRQVAALGRNMVVGTTGWYDRMDEARRAVEEGGVGLIWSGNFSIGVNALFRIIEGAARIFNRLPDYDVLAHEFHHRNKADSPSGTAKMIGRILLDNIDRKTELVYEMLDRRVEPHELHFSSSRGGAIPGTHLVAFDSAVDTIEIRHTARGREGFAVGAIMAAEFIQGRTGFYSIDDLMKDIIIGGQENV
jgi:4-hydroxy-tetrahydrodipicolinate reductase